MQGRISRFEPSKPILEATETKNEDTLPEGHYRNPRPNAPVVLKFTPKTEFTVKKQKKQPRTPKPFGL